MKDRYVEDLKINKVSVTWKKGLIYPNKFLLARRPKADEKMERNNLQNLHYFVKKNSLCVCAVGSAILFVLPFIRLKEKHGKLEPAGVKGDSDPGG